MYGMSRCSQWRRITGFSGQVCLRDGCFSPDKAKNCPEIRVPRDVNRCFQCFLPQEEVLEVSLHVPEVEDEDFMGPSSAGVGAGGATSTQSQSATAFHAGVAETDICDSRRFKDRQAGLLLLFLRTHSVRKEFYKQDPHASTIMTPKQDWMVAKGDTIDKRGSQEFFAWLWNISPLGNNARVIDHVIYFMYQNYVIPAVKKR